MSNDLFHDSIYRYNQSAPCGLIPINRVENKFYSLIEKKDYTSAERVLKYWISEAEYLSDKQGKIYVSALYVMLTLIMNDAEKIEESACKLEFLLEKSDCDDSIIEAFAYMKISLAYKRLGFFEKGNTYIKKAESILLDLKKNVHEMMKKYVLELLLDIYNEMNEEDKISEIKTELSSIADD